MKSLSPAMKSSLESSQYIQSLLLDISVYTTDFHFTTWDQKLLYNDTLYLPRGISVRSVNYGSSAIVETLNLEIDDVDRSIYAVFGEQDAAEFPISLIFVILSDERKVATSLVLFKGHVSQWEYSPGTFKLRASSIFEQWSRITTSTFSGSCRWRLFKGEECKYSGQGIICDRTYSQCLAYNNSENYGGFRYLPSMLNKKLEV